jgi:hypothetical protein
MVAKGTVGEQMPKAKSRALSSVQHRQLVAIQLEHANGVEVMDRNGLVLLSALDADLSILLPPIQSKRSELSNRPGVYILRKTGIVTKGLADKSIELELSPDEVVRLALSALTPAEYLALDKVHGAHFLWSSYTEHGEALHPEASLPPIEEWSTDQIAHGFVSLGRITMNVGSFNSLFFLYERLLHELRRRLGEKND